MNAEQGPASDRVSEPACGPVPPLRPFLVGPASAFGKPVCRLGLASRGRPASAITPDDVLHAVDRGVNFLNWPGFADEPGGADAMSDAIAALGPRRESVVVCVQFGARTAADAAGELRSVLATLAHRLHRRADLLLRREGRGVALADRARRGPRVRPGGPTRRDHPIAGDHQPPAATGGRDRAERPGRRADDPLQRRPPRRRARGLPRHRTDRDAGDRLHRDCDGGPCSGRRPTTRRVSASPGRPTGTASCSSRLRSRSCWPRPPAAPSWTRTWRSSMPPGRSHRRNSTGWPSTASASAGMPGSSPEGFTPARTTSKPRPGPCGSRRPSAGRPPPPRPGPPAPSRRT